MRPYNKGEDSGRNGLHLRRISAAAKTRRVGVKKKTEGKCEKNSVPFLG